MKKLLLSTVVLLSALSAQAELKTVTFDFSNPAKYGYEIGADNGSFVALKPGDQIVEGDVTITNMNDRESDTAVRFWNSNGTVTFRLASYGQIDIEAGGANITAISFVGYNNNPGTNFTTSDDAGWTYDADTKTASWTGNLTKMNITRADKTVQFSTMTVTYDAVAGGGDEPKVEVYTAIETEVTDIKDSIDTENPDHHIYSSTATNVVAPEFANAVIEDGKSEVTFGTANMDVIALGGTTPKDVEETEPGVFPGWAEWNDVKWDNKNQNLDDKKTRYFSYIVGTGNPCVEVGAEAIMTDGVATGRWRATYVYYGPEDTEVNGKVYRNQMPVQGLYYKFMPKADGALKLTVWSNKGNRNTYIVDGETAQPVAYTAEGYINGQNEALEDGTTQKKYLSSEEIQFLHDNAKCQKDETTGEIIPGTDSAPYVIGAGNQNFWGYLSLNVEAGKTYWLFQDSSQIGFAGYEFAPKASEQSIQTIAAPRQDGVVYDLFGRKSNGAAMGRIMIQNGKKVMFR